MRPVVRGICPQDDQGENVIFSNYSQARGELINRMGEFCSYCEMHLDASLAVEHVKPKSLNPDDELNWNNFLLACANCNSTKGTTDVDLEAYLWPDRDNTFYAFQYAEGGLVSASHRLDDTDLKRKAQATILLTGLDKHPLNNPKASDRRWINRRETWDIAFESKQDLAGSDTPEMRRQIIRTATGHAYWSIWMTVFKEDASMLQRLIQAFPGTCSDCFDAADGYNPVPRDGGQC